MSKTRQPSLPLFNDRPSRVPGAAQRVEAMEVFDDWDFARMVPDPTYVPPVEIRIVGLDE